MPNRETKATNASYYMSGPLSDGSLLVMTPMDYGKHERHERSPRFSRHRCISDLDKLELAAELADQDIINEELNDRILKVEKLNEDLTFQLSESNYAHLEKDEVIADLRYALEKAKEELERKDLLLVDHERSKESEKLVSAELANRHMTIVRLRDMLQDTNDLVEMLNQKARDKMCEYQDRLRAKSEQGKKKDEVISQLCEQLKRLTITRERE